MNSLKLMAIVLVTAISFSASAQINRPLETRKNTREIRSDKRELRNDIRETRLERRELIKDKRQENKKRFGKGQG